jgi:glycosyltransferase involved in cell wall biosynthesis
VSTLAPVTPVKRLGPPLVTAIVPAHDEERTILAVLEGLHALALRPQIVVVDDGSTDRTPEILQQWRAAHPEAVVLRQPNRGKGAAVRSGLAHATGEFVVIQDADLEYDPAQLPRLVAPLFAGEADVVYGTRLAGDAERRWVASNRAGNRGLSLLTSALYGRRVTDMETGHKAFRREVLLALDLREDTFAIEPEITAQVLRRRYRLTEVPIAYAGRSHADGKEIHWRDGAAAVRVLLAHRLRR